MSLSSNPAWLLEATDIVKRFGQNEVLRGVSVRARQGDVIAMIGASGSGKSTFLRCLNLLEAPHAGRIALGGETLALVPDTARDAGGALKAADAAQLQRFRSRMVMVFQHFNLWAHLTALENVIEAPMQVLGLSRAEAVALEDAFAVNPRLRGYVLDEQGHVRPNVVIFIDSHRCDDRIALTQPLAASCTVHVLQALSGG